MNRALKNGFPPFLNEQSLRRAIESVCAPFGKVTYLKILRLPPERGVRCVCFLRLDAEAAEVELQRKFDLTRFGKGLHFFADVDRGWIGADM